jgi:hypothetical protein
MRRAFVVESAAAVACTSLALLTLVEGAWIERVFHVDPDGGNGTLEWLVVAASLAAAAVCGAAARAAWRARAG